MMIRRASRRAQLSVLALCAVMGTAASGFAFAQQPEATPAKQPERQRPEGRGPGGPGGPGGAGGEIRSLEGAMKILNGSLRRLGKQLGESDKKSENLNLVASAERAAIAAKGMKPENSPAGSGPDAIKAYQMAQITLARTLLDLEEQILNDKTEDAKKTMTKLGEIKDESHKKFAPPEDENKPKGKPEGGPGKREGGQDKDKK